jgi:hypothetical protein
MRVAAVKKRFGRYRSCREALDRYQPEDPYRALVAGMVAHAFEDVISGTPFLKLDALAFLYGDGCDWMEFFLGLDSENIKNFLTEVYHER